MLADLKRKQEEEEAQREHHARTVGSPAPTGKPHASNKKVGVGWTPKPRVTS